MGKEWRFKQLGGARRILTLSGKCAPHGRPRQRAVVSDGIKLRRARTFYPDGGNRPPTTHIFGTEWKDWVLEGRFTDRELGAGGTQAAIRDWKLMLIDAQPVEITWGDILHVEGLVDDFTPGRESEFEGPYSITLLIDKDALDGGFVDFEIPRTPTAVSQALQSILSDDIGSPPDLPHAGDLKPDFLDTLEDAVSNVNGFSASLITIAGDIDSYADATIDQLERLRAGIVQARTAVNRLRMTYDSTSNDLALIAADAADTQALYVASRAASDVATLRILALLDAMDRDAQLSQRGKTLAMYVAQFGDSWESIATSFFGGPEAAGNIRDANGIKYGALPVPGRSYQIPVGA